MTDTASAHGATGATSPGRRLVAAIADRDRDALEALLDPAVDFRALIPGRSWEARNPSAVADDVLDHWFPEQDRIVAVARIDQGRIVHLRVPCSGFRACRRPGAAQPGSGFRRARAGTSRSGAP